MQKNSFKIYSFVNEFNLSDLHQLSKDICIIYRNYDNINHLENILKIKKYCKDIKTKFYLSNNIKLSIKLGLDGVYIPSFNNKINYVPNYSLPKNFEIIGSAHNIAEINLKLKQKCNEIFLSPVFKVNKSKKFLGVNRFNLMTLNKKANFIALGGINEKNHTMTKLLKINGFASISWAKKNGLRKLRPF
ncbi:MAG: thiamine phosphate synthase [Pelagibacteraceae bacterium]|nr:thiamine phosphate synthase [Pelagibacteraceae bacterium]